MEHRVLNFYFVIILENPFVVVNILQKRFPHDITAMKQDGNLAVTNFSKTGVE